MRPPPREMPHPLIDRAWLHERLLAWHEAHGRKDLPWQEAPTPYRVWVSEIMLQQTRVGTVIAYYRRFMERFPNLATLAQASLDEVLHYWSGLGYYARARNLHRAARVIHEQHAGSFPMRIEEVQALPGIGRSTAGAILALSRGERHPILDGNVRRVLSRLHAIAGWPGKSDVARTLWSLAEYYTPGGHTARYTQAIMDLGATLCTRHHPECERCPLAQECAAYRNGCASAYPAPRPRKTLPVRSTTFVMLTRNPGEVLLERRPPTGIWGGLWSFPEAPPGAALEPWCRERLRCRIDSVRDWPVLRHTFSHFHLDIRPVHARLTGESAAVMDSPGRLWYNAKMVGVCGMAAPVKHLLTCLQPHGGEPE